MRTNYIVNIPQVSQKGNLARVSRCKHRAKELSVISQWVRQTKEDIAFDENFLQATQLAAPSLE
jgi:hypothetical protein